MQELAGFSPSAVSWILLGYGVSVAIGNVWGGKLADKHGAVSALKFIFAALVVLLLVFQLTASIHYAALATVLGFCHSRHSRPSPEQRAGPPAPLALCHQLSHAVPTDGWRAGPRPMHPVLVPPLHVRERDSKNRLLNGGRPLNFILPTYSQYFQSGV